MVGIGGLGCPAAIALARAGIRALGLCDDDEVDRSNLHRQILFGDGDVGAPKLDAAARALRSLATGLELRLHRTRLLPANAIGLVREYDLVLEGSDNFATKFLTSDACAVAGVPVVHASAVRWVGTVLAVGPRGKPCYRCLFEDVPDGDQHGCAEAGVIGPVVGIVAAAQADLAVRMIDGEAVAGSLVTFDGRTDRVRRRVIASRADCPLCGESPSIRDTESREYVSPAPAGC
jgi:molybdopterin/thiamine biosynthesis adenylyltransferase